MAKNTYAFNIIIGSGEEMDLLTTKGEQIEIEGFVCMKHFDIDGDEKCKITLLENGHMISRARSYSEAIKIARKKLSGSNAKKVIKEVARLLKKNGFKYPINN